MEFYIQDTEHCVGNCALWWRDRGAGYTCDLREAGQFTKEEAELVERQSRGADKAFPCEVVDKMAVLHVRVEPLQKMAREQDDLTKRG